MKYILTLIFTITFPQEEILNSIQNYLKEIKQRFDATIVATFSSTHS